MEVKINGENYKIKWSIRAQIYYEALKAKLLLDSGLPELGPTIETTLYYYAILISSNPGIDTESMSLDAFMDACDTSVLKCFRDLLQNDEEMCELINGGDKETVGGEKKS